MEKTIDIIIGETVNVTSPSNTLNLYIKTDNGLELYSQVTIPYLINHVNFLNIPEDPRYFLYEDYDKETEGCRYIVMLKPLGTRKGVYRILNGINLHKVADIEEQEMKLIRK